ncbi:MAG: Mannosylfructose-phosphate synthase [Firmicutes bacterium ADurb.Bin419]|nr:MAG: Mannosylfructose-phosphate synthase [Firmicutes bacterium ADurb.Bin419]
MFLFKGPISKYTGYGKVFRNFLKGMDELKIDYLLRPLSNHIPDYTEESIRDKLKVDMKTPMVGVLLGYGSDVMQLNTPIKLLYTMYETTYFPPDWKSLLGKCSGLIVPSFFCKELFYGFNKYIYISHPGIDTSIYFPNRKNNKDVYTIGTAGVMSPRKGVDLLINAYRIAFSNNTNVKLIIKSRDTRMSRFPIEGLNIEVIDEDWPEDKMAEFYNSLDLFVLPSRGEGLGMTPLEATACGTPSLVTRWSGMTEYIDDKNIYGIEIDDIVTVPDGNMPINGGMWAQPNIKDIAEKMIWFYNNDVKINFNINKWSYLTATRNLMEVINRYL